MRYLSIVAVISLFLFSAQYLVAQCTPTFSTSSFMACDSLLSPSGKYSWKNSGAYMDTINNQGGCDSIMTVYLNITSSGSTYMVGPISQSFCGPQSTTITLASSDTGMVYVMRDILTDSTVAKPEQGTGSAILFNTGTITENSEYYISGSTASSALDFNGVDDYVDLGDNIEGNSEITFESWIYRTGSTGTWMEICSKENVSALALNSGGQLHLNFGRGSTWGGPGLTTGTSVPLNQWTHVAGTRDASNNVKLYINGVLISSGTNSNLGTNGHPRHIGAKSSPGPKNFFIGRIDEVRIWDVARTEEEIKAYMHTCFTGSENHLLANYSFEEGVGSSIAGDKSPNNYVGFLNGMDTITNWVSGADVCSFCETMMTGTSTININNNSTLDIFETSCDNYTSPSGNHNWTASGTYMDTIPNAGGCDSFLTINLTIDTTPSVWLTFPGTRCGPGTVTLQADKGSSSGIINWYDLRTGGTSLDTGTFFTTPSISTTRFYYVGIINGSCVSTRDSAIATIIPVPSITSVSSDTGCTGDTLTLMAIGSSGSIHWFDAPTGGNSLAIGTSFTTPSLNATITYYAESNNNGCKSLQRSPVEAKIYPTPTVDSVAVGSRCGIGQVDLSAFASSGVINWFDSQTGGNPIASGNNYTTPLLTSSTTYYVEATDDGCNSPRQSVLAEIKMVDTTVSQSLDTLTASAVDATYQWLDCDNNFAVIAGETNKTFITGMDGNFAVAVTENGCTDTSACFQVTIIGIEENLLMHRVQVSPNPTRGNLSINLDRIYTTMDVSVRNIAGELVSHQKLRNVNHFELLIKGAKGFYFIELKSGDGLVAIVKIVKD